MRKMDDEGILVKSPGLWEDSHLMVLEIALILTYKSSER